MNLVMLEMLFRESTCGCASLSLYQQSPRLPPTRLCWELAIAKEAGARKISAARKPRGGNGGQSAFRVPSRVAR